jgi:hypothetical protein
MVDKITINIDAPITAQQAMNIATDVTTKFCFAWIDIRGYEYNPECRDCNESELTVLIFATNNQWEFYFVDTFKQFKKGSECAT